MDLDGVFTSAIVPRAVREVVIGVWGNDEAKQQRRVAYPFAWQWIPHQASRLYSSVISNATWLGNQCGLCQETTPPIWNYTYSEKDRIWQRSVLYAALSIAAYVTIHEWGSSPIVTGTVVAAVSLPAALGGVAIWVAIEAAQLLVEAVDKGCFDTLLQSLGYISLAWFVQENYDICPTLLDHFFIDRKVPMSRIALP